MSEFRVCVTGSTGMLGRAVSSSLCKAGLDVVESSRSKGIFFDAEKEHPATLLERAKLRQGDYIINCVGVTKTHIDQDFPETVSRAVNLNSSFPLSLAKVCNDRGIRIIQVATDCVFSGLDGGYSEASKHDALDVYGKSKSLGEVRGKNVMHLRCSLIGPESPGRRSLFFEWIRGLECNAAIRGYVNHKWNGLTSQTFGKVVSGILTSNSFAPGIQHLVPMDKVTKYELAKLELEMLGRTDVEVESCIAADELDRTLATLNPERNAGIFAQAGYRQVPTIREMMEELPWGSLKESRN
jgi:dTDP-4-dehydrorhamnose reductase